MLQRQRRTKLNTEFYRETSLEQRDCPVDKDQANTADLVRKIVNDKWQTVLK